MFDVLPLPQLRPPGDLTAVKLIIRSRAAFQSLEERREKKKVPRVLQEVTGSFKSARNCGTRAFDGFAPDTSSSLWLLRPDTNPTETSQNPLIRNLVEPSQYCAGIKPHNWGRTCTPQELTTLDQRVKPPAVILRPSSFYKIVKFSCRRQF